MTNVFGYKAGSPRGCTEFLEPLFNVRFRRRRQDRPGPGWFVAESEDGLERLVVLPVHDDNDEPVHSAANGYDVLLYVYATNREEWLKRKLASDTRFRYLEPSDKMDRAMRAVFEPKEEH